MLRYFRINDPYRLLGVLLVMIIIYMPVFLGDSLTVIELKSMVIGEKLNEDRSMYTELVDNTGPLAAWTFEIVDSVFGRSATARHILAFILILLQAGYLAIMFITRKVFNENTYIPALLYVVLFSFSFDTLNLSSELIGLTFLLFAVNNLFKELEFRVQPEETVFNLGLFISIASLFSFTFSVFLLFTIVGLAFFTRSTPQRFGLLFAGFLLPHLIILSVAYLNDSLANTWEYFYSANFAIERTPFIPLKSLLVLGSVAIAYFVISIVMLQREARFSKYQSQILQLFFIWIAFACVYLMLCPEFRPQSAIVLVPALAFIFSHFLLFIRRKKFAEMNTWVLILGTVLISFLGRNNYLESIDYSGLLVSDKQNISGKRIMILEDNIHLLKSNQLAGPYLNWSLSESIFKSPEYYENVTEIYKAMQNDKPEIIVDQQGLMIPFFEKIPAIKKEYVRKDSLVLLKVSN